MKFDPIYKNSSTAGGGANGPTTMTMDWPDVAPTGGAAQFKAAQEEDDDLYS
eukprot:GDKH01010028.1.p1 GENE.GDKH01010028.1~~GDKH01010028.1.p1  ORF type:complete len:52 (-),score=16.88 GDKH01010028.1:199-354(-)